MSKQEQHFVVVVVVTARRFSWLGKRRQKCPSFPEKRSRIASPIHQRRHYDVQRRCHSWNTTTTTTTTSTATATIMIRDKQ
jgi:hypothetical protein